MAWLLGRCMGLDDAQRTVLLIFSALPTASSCYVLAVRMGYDGAYAAGLVTCRPCWAWPACRLRWASCARCRPFATLQQATDTAAPQ